MGIPCHVEIDGVPFRPRKPYVFATLPRVGESLFLEWDENEGQYPEFLVYAVHHVPDDVQELQAFTVLKVRKANAR
jgi:hypothetical protein